MISSVQSKGAVPRMMAYAASKAAINSVSRSIAIETAKYGVRCNVLIAGAIRVDKWEDFSDEEVARKRANWPLEREPLRRKLRRLRYSWQAINPLPSPALNSPWIAA